MVVVAICVMMRFAVASAATYEQMDAGIAIVGLCAVALSSGIAVFMSMIDHELARGMAIEAGADVFSSTCTTIFALHTHFGWVLDPQTQIDLRTCIVVPIIITNIHMVFLVLNQIEKDKVRMRGK